MNFLGQLESGYLQINDLDKRVVECRIMANKLGLVIKWRIKDRTATALLKYNNHIMWRQDFTDDLPHKILCKMYAGVYTELSRREKENHEAVLRMRKLEEERNEEKRIMQMPSWQDRYKKQ